MVKGFSLTPPQGKVTANAQPKNTWVLTEKKKKKVQEDAEKREPYLPTAVGR